jgi:glucan phosphoethanolaminetransferase (alkaline phosphatase superfamily)
MNKIEEKLKRRLKKTCLIIAALITPLILLFNPYFALLLLKIMDNTILNLTSVNPNAYSPLRLLEFIVLLLITSTIGSLFLIPLPMKRRAKYITMTAYIAAMTILLIAIMVLMLEVAYGPGH